MQLLAMLTMLIDHVGIVFFPEDIGWRLIGRLALPFYAYALVRGIRLTRSVPRYLLRLAVTAGVSQLPYWWALDGTDINVVGTLLVCLLVLWSIERFRHPAAIGAVTLAAVALLELLPFNYGAYALLLVLIYRFGSPHMANILHFALNILFIVYKMWFSQLFSMFSTMLLYYWPDALRAIDRIPVPRALWRLFYPAHLVALGAARYLLL